jgi:hypothetical protein
MVFAVFSAAKVNIGNIGKCDNIAIGKQLKKS